MKPFSTIHGRAIPLIVDNVDTDTIIPSREIRTTGRTGLAEGLFAPWRYADADRRIPNPEFALNTPQAAGAQIVLGGRNFGCGSSREHAVWALAEFGIKCIIAPGFAPIFRANCVRNGLLPVVLSEEVVRSLADRTITVDLPEEEIRADGEAHGFAIDPEARQMLLEGLDAIDLTLAHSIDIASWTEADRRARPWVYLDHSR